MDNKFFDIQKIDGDNTYLYLTVDGNFYQIRWDHCSSRLRRATSTEQLHIEVDGDGYGLHWPLLDEDLTTKGLLQRAETLIPEMAIAG